MAGIWIVGEPGADGALARISTEVATLGRTLGERARAPVTGVVVAADPASAAAELARFVPRVLALTEPDAAGHAWAPLAGDRIAALIEAGAADGLAGEPPDLVLVGAGPDGRDVAGCLAGLLGWGVLGNTVGAGWDGGIRVDKSVLGGKLEVTSGLTDGRGVVTVRPNAVEPVAADAAGIVVAIASPGDRRLPAVRIVEQIAEAGAAVPIEEARVVVAGGRGVAGAEGFAVVQQLADALGGAVGATRAAVDAGWIPYAQQIGQTGKVVKPQLYVALGISGAIQHKVGMQTAQTIVAVNRDPDAPIAEFADVLVVGDLFDVVPALVAELRARSS